jgi:hypothetical protein
LNPTQLAYGECVWLLAPDLKKTRMICIRLKLAFIPYYGKGIDWLKKVLLVVARFRIDAKFVGNVIHGLDVGYSA